MNDRLKALLASRTVQQLWRFVLIGGLATALQYATLVALVELFGAQPTLASALGYLIGTFTTYTLNRRFTFASSTPYWVGFAKTLPLYLVGLGLNTGIMAGLMHFGVYYLFAQIAATGLVLIYNYAVSRWIVFRS